MTEILGKQELLSVLSEEKKLYLGDCKAQAKKMKRIHHKRYVIWRYLSYFRYCQYYRYISKNSHKIRKIINKKIYKHYDRLRGIYSEKAGVEIGINSRIGKCCDIWHSGVVINGVIGDYCIIHGNNIIGNKGKGRSYDTPTIGDGVDIGAGAVVIGKIYIADGIKIGAGAVVTKTFKDKDSTVVGVPANVVVKNEISKNNM